MAKAPLYPVLVLLLYSNRLGNTSVLPNKRGVGAVCRPPFLLGVVSHFQTCAGGLTQPHCFRGPFLLEATVASKFLLLGLSAPIFKRNLIRLWAFPPKSLKPSKRQGCSPVNPCKQPSPGGRRRFWGCTPQNPWSLPAYLPSAASNTGGFGQRRARWE